MLMSSVVYVPQDWNKSIAGVNDDSWDRSIDLKCVD